MNLNKRILAAGLMGTVLIASLTGCGSSRDITFEEGEEKTELTFSWWGPDDRNEYTIVAVKEFEKQHPDEGSHRSRCDAVKLFLGKRIFPGRHGIL